MTGRSARVAPWVASGTAVLALVVLVAAGTRFAQADASALVRSVEDAEVDWSAGTITARAGSAADFRFPSAEIARPGAERRARAAAMSKLRRALDGLPLGGGRKLSGAVLDASVARARTASVDYQSNGGALVTLSLRFGDIGQTPDPSAEKTPEPALVIDTMPFELTPRIVAGQTEGTLTWAVYRLGAPPVGSESIAVRRDQAGRLVLPKTAGKKLAGAPAVIYLQKVAK